MSDGMTEMYRREQIEREKKRQELKEKFAKIIDDYKWVICEELIRLSEDQ